MMSVAWSKIAGVTELSSTLTMIVWVAVEGDQLIVAHELPVLGEIVAPVGGFTKDQTALELNPCVVRAKSLVVMLQRTVSEFVRGLLFGYDTIAI
jgi:hypothetical protein